MMRIQQHSTNYVVLIIYTQLDPIYLSSSPQSFFPPLLYTSVKIGSLLAKKKEYPKTVTVKQNSGELFFAHFLKLLCLSVKSCLAIAKVIRDQSHSEVSLLEQNTECFLAYEKKSFKIKKKCVFIAFNLILRNLLVQTLQCF